MTTSFNNTSANNIKASVKTFWNDEEGATAVEYGLIASLIGAFIALAVSTLGQSISGVFTSIATQVTAHHN